jgi:plastocyanin domain-containing protein
MTLLTSRRHNRASGARASAAADETLIRVRGRYLPSVVHAEAGKPVLLVFLREETAVCSEQVLFPAFGRSVMLPPGERVRVYLPACAPGTYEFSCAMGVLRGALTVS